MNRPDAPVSWSDVVLHGLAWLCLFSAVAVPRAPRLQAQEAPRMVLGEGEAFPGGQFTVLTSVRELRDGRLLVGDLREQRLALLDWNGGRVQTIGRLGTGPGEYRGAGFIYPLSGDSALFTDPVARHWYIVHGTRIARRIIASAPVARELGPLLSGSDTSGHVLGVVGFVGNTRARSSRENGDSLFLVLGDRRTARIDTLLALGGAGASLSAIRGGRAGMVMYNPLAAEEQALLFPDGWIAVARLAPYRVDWRAPNGHWTRGPPLPFDHMAVDNNVKCAALNQTRDFCNHRGFTDWPAVLPPFLPPGRLRHNAGAVMSLFATPQGELLIWRTDHPQTQGRRYDLVDRAGNLKGVLTLPDHEAVIGFGARHVYTITTDDSDLQQLRRYAWP